MPPDPPQPFSQPATEGGRSQDGPPDAQKDREKKGLFRRQGRRGALIVGGLVLLVLIVAGVLWWLHARQFETTDDAFVDTHIVRVAPRVSGRVVAVFVENFQAVKAGQPLAQLDPADYQAQLDQALASKAQAEAQIAQAQAQLAQINAQVQVNEANVRQATSAAAANDTQAAEAARDLARYQSLKALNPHAVAQQQLDQATAQARSTAAQRDAALHQADAARAQVRATAVQRANAQAQIAAAKAQVQNAEAQIQAARLNVGYTLVRAPQDGTIAQRTVAVGNFVNAGAQLMAVVPFQLWVTANFKETQLADMRPGQAAAVHVDACPHYDFRGHVDSIQRGSGQVFGVLPPENATGNFVKVVQRVPVKIVIDEHRADCPLGPGLSVVPRVRVR